jgi:isopentenyl diphosphate isomerase/L-lactate dehydrogenase-like FMN-dependent dehydrogenase
MKKATSIDDIRTISEMVALARQHLAGPNWDYLVGGAESETTLKRNRLALDRIAFRPRVLRNVLQIDVSAQILGQHSALPLFLAPVGRMDHFHEDAALPAACAASRFGVPYMLSSVTAPGPEVLRNTCDGNLFFQLYARDDMKALRETLDQVSDLGYGAFCLTVDSDIYGRRERDKINRFEPRPSDETISCEFDFLAALDWNLLDQIRSYCKIPLILKGIATAEDARLAVEHGVDVIHVSNHGGRQLDHGLGSVDVLPEVVAAVAGQATVFVDGGFCRGSDVVKALALGADVVGLGKIYVSCLAAFGEAGVYRMLQLFEEEIRTVMTLLGVRNYGELMPDHITTAEPINALTFDGPFPGISI